MRAYYHAPIALLLGILGSSSLYAADGYFLTNVEISGAGGANWLNTKNTHIKISSFETDSDRVTSTTVEGAWRVGIGYSFFRKHVLMELNVYGVSNTAKGDVWQYELPQFNNYTFNAPISSTRLMLDFKPRLITWNKFSPYLILGTGVTWNTMSYKDEANPGIDPDGTRSLSDETTTQLAWDLGAGLSYGVTKRLNISAEYVYAFLGDVSPQKNSSVIEAPNFSYQIQSLLFGLSLNF